MLLIDGLGFGSANVVVAVPQAWIDVRTMADLDDVTTGFRAQHNRRMRVATKYINLTRNFFAAHGIVDYRIVESAGATEGAPAAGTAEMIVDITTTGATLAANGLKVLDDGVILKSQANLVASREADWSTRRARPRASSSITSRPAPAPANTARSARAFRLRRHPARRSAQPLRRGRPVRRADLVGHADAALPAGAALCAGSFLRDAWRRDGLGRLAGLCARPGEPAVRQARGFPAAVRRRIRCSS